MNHRAAIHLRISAWRAKFYPGARRYAVRPTHVTVSAVDHFVSDQPCKLQGVDHATLRRRRGTRETCAKRYSARLLTLISVTGEARVARTPGLGNGT
jgi:hypothetical protein